LAHPDIPGEPYQSMVTFISFRLSQLLFLPNAAIAWIILATSFILVLILTIKFFRVKSYLNSYSLLLLLFIIPVLFYIAEKTNSDAYLPVFYPTVAFMFAILFDKLLAQAKLFYWVIIILALYCVINIYSYLHSNYMNDRIVFTLPNRIKAAEQIIKKSGGKAYNLIGYGPGSQYASFTMNYQYLTWWLGHGPSESNQPSHIYITEKASAKESVIIVKKNSK